MFKKTFSYLTSEWKMGFCSVSGIWFRLKDISRIEIKEAAWYISMNSKWFFGGKSNHIDHTFSVSTWTFIHAFCAKLAVSFFVNQKENSSNQISESRYIINNILIRSRSMACQVTLRLAFLLLLVFALQSQALYLSKNYDAFKDVSYPIITAWWWF